MLNNLLQNQKLFHIVSEFLILIVLIYYYNQKYKKMLSYIEDLVQRVEEQEEIIQKHDQILKSLVSQQLQKIQQPTQVQVTNTQQPTQVQVTTTQQPQSKTKKIIKKVEQPKIEEIEEEQKTDLESNLDMELHDELNELNNLENEIEITEVNLKKK